MKTDTEDADYTAALKDITAGLQADLRAVRKLTLEWMYLRQWSQKSLSFSYGYVRHPADKGSDWETLVIFADRESGGRLRRRYFDGFQFGAGKEIRPVPKKLLTELGERLSRI